MLTARFTDAVEYARAHHRDDVRKGTTDSLPVAPARGQSALVLEHGGDETQAVAALLHDVVEDGGGEAALAEIGRRFGADVASDRRGLQRHDRGRQGGLGNCARSATSSTSRSPVPTCCSSRPATSSTTRAAILADLREHGDELWARFNRGSRDQLWYYGALRDVYCAAAAGPARRRARPHRARDQPPRGRRRPDRLAGP